MPRKYSGPLRPGERSAYVPGSRANKKKGKRTYNKKGIQNQFKLRRPLKNQVKQIAPIAETKKYRWATGMEANDTLDVQGIREFYVNNDTNTATFLPLHSFLFMKRNLVAPSLPGSVMGKDIFSKYLSMKIEVLYPQARYGPTRGARPLEIVYGFVSPINLSNKTTPDDSKPTNNDIITHITEQVDEDFDDSNDPMQFKDARRRSYNIIGRIQCKPDRRHIITGPIANAESGTALSTNGDTPSKIYTINFPMMKKVRMEQSDNLGDGGVGPVTDPFIYPNQAYLPFVLLYNKDKDAYEDNVPATFKADGSPLAAAEDHQIKIRYQDCHWFNDF
jgi:hypothetical protein